MSPDPSMTARTIEDVYDLVGIGFGPANLALSIALRESQEAQESQLNFIFVEKQPHFAWHSSLLLPGAQLQVSPLKDLATMRDPTSSYTFFNYLHQQGRLAAYINREANIPSRMEWSAYLAWAARRMEDSVEYSQEVVRVEAEHLDADDDRIRLFKVTTRHLQTSLLTTRSARNITVGVGGIPRLPTPFQQHYRSQKENPIKQIIHSSTYLPSLAALEPMLREREARRLASSRPSTSMAPHLKHWAPLRFAVIGGGQSAAEMSLHLRRTFPNSNVKLIFRASALVPSDDSAFVNSAAFDPDRIDVFWKANAHDRKAWVKEFRRTNYSVVRSDVLNQINEQLYEQRIEFDQPWPNADGRSGFGKLEVLPNVEVCKVEKDVDDGQLRISTTHSKLLNHEEQYTVDVVFLGTGFQRQANVFDFLEPIAHHYPLLDKNRDTRIEQLGFNGEEETNETISTLMMSGDEDAVEGLRLRCRGIARDYRLVSYTSDAFTHRSTAHIESSTSGSSSPTTPTSSIASSGTTLASNKVACHTSHNNEASIFFLGGNEETHGLADSLLSIVAHRAGELSESIISSHAASASLNTQSKDTLLPHARTTLLNKGTLDTLKERIQTMQVE